VHVHVFLYAHTSWPMRVVLLRAHALLLHGHDQEAADRLDSGRTLRPTSTMLRTPPTIMARPPPTPSIPLPPASFCAPTARDAINAATSAINSHAEVNA
jgi:hypothetical protein